MHNQIEIQKKKSEEEKRQIEQNFQDEIQQLKVVIESSKQKVEMANQLTAENQELLKQVDTLKTNNENIIKKHITENKTKDVKNEIKFTNLKKKMKEKIDQIQAKETELNVQYMDVSTKLTLLELIEQRKDKEPFTAQDFEKYKAFKKLDINFSK